MVVTVRRLRDDEIRLYLEIHERAIRGLAGSHYSQGAIEGWVVPPTDENVRRLGSNADREIRLVAELDGRPVGIGALVLETAELRAVYVAPEGARQGCGTALVQEKWCSPTTIAWRRWPWRRTCRRGRPTRPSGALYGKASATHSGIWSRSPTATTRYCRPSWR